MPRVVVVGLDGGTWNLLEPWANQGELPTLKKLMQGGTWGVLESTNPPLTGPAWVSFSTGTNPGKHGIFGFTRLENDRGRLFRSGDVSSATIPELQSRREQTSVVVGLPLSFPPSPRFRGVMVSDFLHHDKDIVPKSKRHYIEEYKVIPVLSLRGDELLAEIFDTAERQVRVGKELFLKESWDLFIFYFGMTDTILHFFWDDVANDTTQGRKARTVFRIADEFLQWVLDHVDADTVLFVVSDHGFQACPTEVNLNTLLMEKGWLRTRDIGVGEPGDETLTAHMKHLRARTGQETQAKPKRTRWRKGARRRTVVDYANSTAFVLDGCSSPHVGAAAGGDRERIVRDIMAELESLEHEGKKVFDQVMARDDVYRGPLAEYAPDILLVPNGFIVGPKLGRELFTEYAPGSFHDPNGIFLAYGSGIGDSLGQPAGLRIYDVAPTILHVLDVPVPEDMDGRVLREVFVEASDLARRETVFQTAVARDEERRVSERVRKLLGLRKI